MTRGPILYYFDFVVFPIFAVALFALQCRSLSWAALGAAGVLLFSFAEYWVHRLALHGFFYHGQHERHHTHPTEYVVFPFWFTPLIFAGFWLTLPAPIFAGMVVGYCWFLIWHHTLHHIADLTRWPRFVQRYAIWHLAHHRDETCNYGITLPVFDWMFGSYRKTT